MNNLRSRCIVAAHILLILSMVLLLLGGSGHFTDESLLNTVYPIENVTAVVNGGPEQTVTLPHSFRNLEPRTPVTITAQVLAQPGDEVYLKSVYAPAKVYVDDTLIYQFGVKEDYPDFMMDPATEVRLCSLRGTGDHVTLRMEFLSPRARNTLTVHPPVVGEPKLLIFNLFHAMGLPLIFSIIQMVGGIALICISLCIILIDRKGILFLWLGLFSFTTGMWAFGENNFTVLAIKNPTVLYLIAFMGLFTFIVPLIRFIRNIVDFEHTGIIDCMELFFAVSAGIALLLQLGGSVPCSRSMYFFHALIPPALVFLTLFTAREFIRFRNINAKRMVLPLSILALSALLELFNYRFPVTFIFSSVFQMGILFFLLVMGVTAGLTVRNSIELKESARELEFQKSLVDIQIKEQKERGLLLANKEQILRRQRHDLRHQVAALQELARDAGPELQEYLQGLMDQIPQRSEYYCENRTVNAIISHYAALCEKEGIELALNLAVPACEDAVLESELCVVFGNLLENAEEACGRMNSGHKFIRLNSTFHLKMLTITMDNSFDGNVSSVGGRFRSSKRDDFGVGTQSVRSVAEKFHGNAEFRAEGDIFYSSVYLQLP